MSRMHLAGQSSNGTEWWLLTKNNLTSVQKVHEPSAILVNFRSNFILQAPRTKKKAKGIAVFRTNTNLLEGMLLEYLRSGQFYISENLRIVPATQDSGCNRCANIRSTRGVQEQMARRQNKSEFRGTPVLLEHLFVRHVVYLRTCILNRDDSEWWSSRQCLMTPSYLSASGLFWSKLLTDTVNASALVSHCHLEVHFLVLSRIKRHGMSHSFLLCSSQVLL